MPADAKKDTPKPGPYSRPPLPLPVVGTMPKGTLLWVGRGGQWVIGRVVRWSGAADDSSHWYELTFEAVGGASEWHDLAPARRAIGTATSGSWAFPEDEDISLRSAGARRRGSGGGAAAGEQQREHACSHCAAAFSTASKLTRHVHVVHEKRRDHVCPH